MRSRFPLACGANFEELAYSDPALLMEWIESRELKPSLLTYAIEALGDAKVEDINRMLVIIRRNINHEKFYMRDGVLLAIEKVLPRSHGLIKIILENQLSKEANIDLLEDIRDLLEYIKGIENDDGTTD